MLSWLNHVDDIGVWIAAVVAGLTALGWVGNRLRRAYRAARPWIDRAKAVVELAEYELQHNGGGSIKDAVAQIPVMNDRFAIHIVQAAVRDDRLTKVETALTNLAEALPVVARSTPAPDDAA
mgnify:CR=1 FL=1